jgi:hypothetical protein
MKIALVAVPGATTQAIRKKSSATVSQSTYKTASPSSMACRP